MVGNPKVLKSLNEALRKEISAVLQYMVRSEWAAHQNYSKLADYQRKLAMGEMHHAERLIERILLLDGIPELTKLEDVKVPDDVPDQLEQGLQSELAAVTLYNEASETAAGLPDSSSRDFFGELMADEEKHAEWTEAQLDQIAKMGIDNYLSAQV
jgi:bacterioferritin